MMELFIRVVDGQPFEHPLFLENLQQVFPDFDPANLPKGFVKFVRITPPVLGPYEMYDGVTYEWDGTAFTDAHRVRPMTDEEKAAKDEQLKTLRAQSVFPSWKFDEATGAFKPPVDPPKDGKPYRWNEATLSWVTVTLPWATPAV